MSYKSSITGHRFPTDIRAADLTLRITIYRQSARFVTYKIAGFGPFDLPFEIMEALEDQQNVTVMGWLLAPADSPNLKPRDYLVHCRKMECIHVSYGVI